MITLAISLIKITKCYCMWLSCGTGEVMCMCHKEVTSQCGVRISILTQWGRIVYDSHGILPSHLDLKLLIPPAHIIAGRNAVVRDHFIWWSGPSPPGWPSHGAAPQSHRGDRWSYLLSHRWSPTHSKVREMLLTSWPMRSESSFFFQSFLLLPFPQKRFLQHGGCGGDTRRKNKNHWGT